MKKVSVFLMITAMAATLQIVQAEIQSPIYTDGIGRSHFMGKGGYSTVKQIQVQGMEANVVNDAVDKYSQKTVVKTDEIKQDVEETIKSTTADITKVIKENSTVPVNSVKATYTSEQRKMDPSAPFGYGMTNINSGVNESKTIYTDDIGRLHFFGRANLIKE